MPDPLSSPRWSRRVLSCCTLALVGTAVAACGSGQSGASTPQGLSGTQAGVAANPQYVAEEQAAATVLAPTPGSFLAGKTDVTVLGSTTPGNGDINPYAIWPVTETVGSVKIGRAHV